MVTPGLGITPACERLVDEGDQLLEPLRRWVEVPGSPSGSSRTMVPPGRSSA